jgi:hypothetical protein
MRKVFEEVLIFCPEYLNGGCEALHQLGYHIARHGGTAHMAYYTPLSHLELDGDILRCHPDSPLFRALPATGAARGPPGP